MVIIKETLVEAKEIKVVDVRVKCGRKHTYRLLKYNQDVLFYRTLPAPAPWVGVIMLEVCVFCNKVKGHAKVINNKHPDEGKNL